MADPPVGFNGILLIVLLVTGVVVPSHMIMVILVAMVLFCGMREGESCTRTR